MYGSRSVCNYPAAFLGAQEKSDHFFYYLISLKCKTSAICRIHLLKQTSSANNIAGYLKIIMPSMVLEICCSPTQSIQRPVRDPGVSYLYRPP